MAQEAQIFVAQSSFKDSLLPSPFKGPEIARNGSFTGFRGDADVPGDADKAISRRVWQVSAHRSVAQSAATSEANRWQDSA